ncbi:transposase [Streptomyces sp. NPDC047737]|uniref:transposase n=1 Tax=unclassified Streptomyces TaxID=2593676 RepID=UPI00340F4EB0
MRTIGARGISREYDWLAPMVLWPLARRIMPVASVRPQGGGTRRLDDEAVFACILYVLVSESPWRAVPDTFGTSWQTAHRRFRQLCEAGIWERLELTTDVPGMPPALRYWAAAVRRAAAARDGSRPNAPGLAEHGAAPPRPVARGRHSVTHPDVSDAGMKRRREARP